MLGIQIKHITPQLFLLCAWTGMSMTANAQLIGTDKFEAPRKDSNFWDQDFRTGRGRASQSQGTFRYSSDSARGQHEAGWPWIGSSAEYREDWTFQIDVFNEQTVTTEDEFASVGLYVASLRNEEDLAYIELYATIDSETGTQINGVASGLETNQGPIHEADSFELESNFGALQVRFDATSKILTFLYHSGPIEQGYAWRPLARYGIAGANGLEANALWLLDDSSELDIGIFGYSQNIEVDEGDLRIDNFDTGISKLQSELPIEVFLEQNQDGNRELWWKAFAGFNYVPEESSNLDSWSPLLNQVNDVGDWMYIPLPSQEPAQFFRVLTTPH